MAKTIKPKKRYNKALNYRPSNEGLRALEVAYQHLHAHFPKLKKAGVIDAAIIYYAAFAIPNQPSSGVPSEEKPKEA